MERFPGTILAGETFLVLNGISFWKGVYERAIPGVHSIMQRDREVFTQLIESSDMPRFTTDTPQNGNHAEGRAEAPISDASAHATFYLVALSNTPACVHEVVDWVNSTT